MSNATDPDDDPFAGLQQKLGMDVMRAFQGIPSVLNALFEGKAGPVDLPGEQFAAVIAELAPKLLMHLQNIAGAVDLTRGEVAQLRARVEALERQLGER